jgi:hypothetical protein
MESHGSNDSKKDQTIKKIDKYKLKEIDITQLKITPSQCTESKIIKNFTCSTCESIPINPKACSGCDKVFCSNCIVAVGDETEPRCLNCSKVLSPRELTKLELVTLLNFSFTCFNSKCGQVLDYKAVIDHYRICIYTKREANCLGCGAVIATSNTLDEVNEHVKACQLLPDLCKYCKRPFVRNELESHYESCDKREVDCMYCGLKFLQSEIDNHRRKVCVEIVYRRLKELEYQYQNTNEELVFVKGKDVDLPIRYEFTASE